MRFFPTDSLIPFSRRRRVAMVAGIAFTQMTAWGTTFYVPSVLGRAMAHDIGISVETQFGGITLMLMVAAFLSPTIGRFIEQHGARLPMMAGSVILAAGLALLAAGHGASLYLASWVLIGMGVPLAMSSAAFSAIAQAFPGQGRRPITLLMLLSGLSSGVYWPVTSWLAAHIGWRETLLVFMGVHLCLCLPLHMVLVRRFSGENAASGSAQGPLPQTLAPEKRRRAYWLVVMGASLSGLVSWGAPLQFIAMFREAGLSETSVIVIAALQSPSALLATLFDLGPGRRLGAVTLVVYSATIAPLVFVGFWIALQPPVGPGATALLTLSVMVYGVCTALITAARSTLPLELFGPLGYSTMLGRMSFWLNIVFALSPLLFALLRGRGLHLMLLVSLVLSIMAALVFIRLGQLVGVEPQKA